MFRPIPDDSIWVFSTKKCSVTGKFCHAALYVGETQRQYHPFSSCPDRSDMLRGQDSEFVTPGVVPGCYSHLVTLCLLTFAAPIRRIQVCIYPTRYIHIGGIKSLQIYGARSDQNSGRNGDSLDDANWQTHLVVNCLPRLSNCGFC